MTETSLSLIRHGQTDWNFQRRMQGRADIPLNDTGREQARAVGEELAASGGSWDVLVSSPLSRARETAEIIGRAVGLEVRATYEDLVERGFGDLEGEHYGHMSAEERHAFTEPYGEPTAQVVGRGVAVLQRIVAEHPDRNVLVVSHGTFIRLTVGHILHRRLHSFANGEVITVPTAAVLVAALGGLPKGA